MKEDQAQALFRKLKSGTATPEETQLLEQWLLQYRSGEPAEFSDEDLQAAEARIWEKIGQGQMPVKRVLLWPRIVAAASIVLALGAGVLVYFNRQVKPNEQLVQVNDVAPGKQGATLTLAGGRKIRLAAAANGELAREAGVVIAKSKEGRVIYQLASGSGGADKINTLSTANGETYGVRLPDGSEVWLNAASSLTYSASLIKEGRRSVRLNGEAYFEVAKDKAHPFIVETAGQQVEVLGTHFDINSYADEPGVATTLLEGSVKVSAGKGTATIVPGEQAVTRAGQISIAKVNTGKIIDWKEGEFNLEDVDFRGAMRKIARWYNVEVVYDQSVPEHIQSWGLILRSRTLSAVLRSIENSGQVRFRIDGRKVYVFK
jgi:ferric-dicitrate binding protein FerR (iron transport regulator)